MQASPSANLERTLRSINNRPYPAYRDCCGRYSFPGYFLSIDHVQPDPYAPPSKLRLTVPSSSGNFPSAFFDEQHRRVALQDHLLRLFSAELEKNPGENRCYISISKCPPEILDRACCVINPSTGDLTLRIGVGFPARGRTIESMPLIRLLFQFLPGVVQRTLWYSSLPEGSVASVSALADDWYFLQSQLRPLGLVSFIANGSILPRQSGISPAPMPQAVPFVSPPELEVSIDLPHHGAIRGMGIRAGVTLIIGGGYHGKSTVIHALEVGVYPHISGDGREYVATDPTAFKLRAEDGRSVRGTDISLFIRNLPNGRDTRSFESEDASGSTSQAANLIEAIEAGSSLFLIDEDTSASNFMVRDELMQRVVHGDKEPITPFIERVRELYEKMGVSSIIVAGSSGAFFHVSDCVVQMDCYRAKDVTELAKREAEAFPLPERQAPPFVEPDFTRRKPKRGHGGHGGGNRGGRAKARGTDNVSFNHEDVDVKYLEQLVDSEQANSLAQLLARADSMVFDGRKTMREVVETLYTDIHERGIGAATSVGYDRGDVALPRRQEIFGCLNRYRSLKL